jgi:hypothetical protein
MHIYENNFKKVIIKGIDKSNPSNRSKNPPCPGIVSAESLMFILRLNEDSTKSPYVPATTIMNPMENHCQGA